MKGLILINYLYSFLFLHFFDIHQLFCCIVWVSIYRYAFWLFVDFGIVGRHVEVRLVVCVSQGSLYAPKSICLHTSICSLVCTPPRLYAPYVCMPHMSIHPQNPCAPHTSICPQVHVPPYILIFINSTQCLCIHNVIYYIKTS